MVILNKNEIIDKILNQYVDIGLINIIGRINEIEVVIPALEDLMIEIEGNTEFDVLNLIHDKYKIKMKLLKIFPVGEEIDSYGILNLSKTYCVDEIAAYDFNIKLYYKIDLEL